MKHVITKRALKRRAFWIDEIKKLSGNFSNDWEKLEEELENEIKRYGKNSLIDHLRLCGTIPESYVHDSSEEKLYSKYTDSLLSLAYKSIGLKSIVLKERSDAADVEVVFKNYSFVSDAKAFRLSRSAKNQKDFKIQAMDNWKRGKKYAMVVAPIYQLPGRSSQIYYQASTRNVCIFTFSHLSLLVAYSSEEGASKANALLHKILRLIPLLNPSKNALDYWLAINKTMIEHSKIIEELWEVEKRASAKATQIAKEEGLTYWSNKRESLMKMSHEEAIKEIIRISKIDNKIKIIESISDNGLFTIK